MSNAVAEKEPCFDFLHTRREGDVECFLEWKNNRLKGKVRLVVGEERYSMCSDGQWVPDHGTEEVEEISADDFEIHLQHEPDTYPAQIEIDIDDMTAVVRQDFSC